MRKDKDLYFEMDQGQLWDLPKKNGCFVCRKYTYVTIFYCQDGENLGLIEIKDIEFLNNLEKNLDIGLKDQGSPPVILGSVVGGFSRKL